MSKVKSESSVPDSAIVLNLLNAVEQESRVTQRGLASDLGIALGMANAYLRRCVRKGLIKVRQAPANRYSYYLTPKGFSEKARLTADYMSTSFTFFRRAKDQCAAELDTLIAEGKTRIALAGVSELAEVAALCQFERDVTLVGIVDKDSHLTQFAGLPVVDRFDELAPADAVMITDVRKTVAVCEAACEFFGAARVRAPTLLGLERVLAEARS